MTNVRYPAINERWQLKSNPKKIVTITSVDINEDYLGWGYVGMAAPWLKSGHTGKPMDTFLKLYQPAPPSADV